MTIHLHPLSRVTIIVTIIVTVDPSDGATLFAECWRDIEVLGIGRLHWNCPGVRVNDLQAIVWLPHTNNVPSLRVSPDVMSPKVEVIQLHVLPEVFDMKLLTAHVLSVLRPISTGRVVMIMHCLARVSTDTLLHSAVQSVHDPHETAYVAHDRRDVAHPAKWCDRHVNLFVIEDRCLLLDIVEPLGLFLTVAEGPGCVVAREELEAERVSLAANEDLVVARVGNGVVVWLNGLVHRLWVNIRGVGNRFTTHNMDVFVIIIPGDAADTLTEATAWVVVLVTTPLPVPTVWPTLPRLPVSLVGSHALWLTVIRTKVLWVEGVRDVLWVLCLIMAPGAGVLLLSGSADSSRGFARICLAHWRVGRAKSREERDLRYNHGESIHGLLSLRNVVDEPHDGLVNQQKMSHTKTIFTIVADFIIYLMAVSVATHSLKFRGCGSVLGLLGPFGLERFQRLVSEKHKMNVRKWPLDFY